MSSRADRASFAAALAALLGAACGANGDQVLGFVREKGPIQTDASTPTVDSGGLCLSTESPGREIAFDLDIYFLIDRSRSMLDPAWDKWDGFFSGFTRF